jgi:hypothetical protein
MAAALLVAIHLLAAKERRAAEGELDGIAARSFGCRPRTGPPVCALGENARPRLGHRRPPSLHFEAEQARRHFPDRARAFEPPPSTLYQGDQVSSTPRSPQDPANCSPRRVLPALGPQIHSRLAASRNHPLLRHGTHHRAPARRTVCPALRKRSHAPARRSNQTA